MSQSKKNFIITMDESTANEFLAVGFKLISKNGGKCVFLNQPPKNFNFEQFDKTKFCYTDMLTL